MTKTLARTDPRRIACPHCAAPIGAWCAFKARGGAWVVSDGGIHRHRAKLAHTFRTSATVSPAQLRLFGGAR